ncbi:hypothetical protein BH10PSE19_BH10PSE19_14130 [soil metagenome]
MLHHHEYKTPIEFVTEVNRFFIHLKQLFHYLQDNLEGIPVPNFDSVVVATNVSEAKILLSTLFEIQRIDRFLSQIELYWKENKNHSKTTVAGISKKEQSNYPFLDMNWYSALVEADHNPNISIYPAYGFQEELRKTAQPTQEYYLTWLQGYKTSFATSPQSLVAVPDLVVAPEPNLVVVPESVVPETKVTEVDVTEKGTKKAASLSEKLQHTLNWCGVNKNATLPFVLLTATLLTLFPYTIPIIACVATFVGICVAIAASETVRQFVEKYKNPLGAIMAAMTLFLWLPIFGVGALTKAVAWLNNLGPTSLDLLPNTINAAYANAVSILGGIGAGFIALWNWRTDKNHTMGAQEEAALTNQNRDGVIPADPTFAPTQSPTPQHRRVGHSSRVPSTWQPQPSTTSSAYGAQSHLSFASPPPIPPPASDTSNAGNLVTTATRPKELST